MHVRVRAISRYPSSIYPSIPSRRIKHISVVINIPAPNLYKPTYQKPGTRFQDIQQYEEKKTTSALQSPTTTTTIYIHTTTPKPPTTLKPLPSTSHSPPNPFISSIHPNHQTTQPTTVQTPPPPQQQQCLQHISPQNTIARTSLPTDSPLAST